MKNDKFWNECTDDSIRQKIAEFIDTTPAVSKLKDKAYYDFEEALVSFVYENRDMISKEVDLEYQREDLVKQVKEDFGADAKKIIDSLPLEVIDRLIAKWQDALSGNDSYWEIMWDSLNDVLSDGGICSFFSGIENYETKDIQIYAAYLKEWFSDHPFDYEDPVCIDEFFDCEIQDEQIYNYYVKRASQLFGKDFKGK